MSISLQCRLSRQNKCHLFPPLQCQTTLSWGCWQNAWAPSTAWAMAGCSLASPGTWGRESSCRKHRLIPTGKGGTQPPQCWRYDRFVCGKIQIFIDIIYAAASQFLLPQWGKGSCSWRGGNRALAWQMLQMAKLWEREEVCCSGYLFELPLKPNHKKWIKVWIIWEDVFYLQQEGGIYIFFLLHWHNTMEIYWYCKELIMRLLGFVK